jgi:putative ABC transport system permease protein
MYRLGYGRLNMAQSIGWGTAWKIARRDLHRRFRGLRLLLVCLFLGVGALAAIGSLTANIRGELEDRGREILGGDLEIEVWQRDLTEAELTALQELGEISGGTRMQAMASTGNAAVPIELKAVDSAWPLVGTLTLADGSAAAAPESGEAYLSEGAARRLGLGKGDSVSIGGIALQIAGVIGEEPDRLSEGFSLGPPVIVARDMPERAGLTAPGSMYQSKYRVAFDNEGRDPSSVQEELEEQFPASGFDFRTRDRASPGADRFVSRLGEFLTLVGLAALLIAGIGIGGGVASYLEARRQGIATLKILGATSRDITRIYTLQIGAATLAGAVAGVVAGLLVTPLVGQALGDLLPVRSGFLVDPPALIRAALFGMLVALVFAAPPLIRARHFPAMTIMRGRVAPLKGNWRAYALPVGFGLAGILALALLGAPQPWLSALFLAGAGIVLGLLSLVGWAIRAAAARAPRPRDPILRAALANLYRPGARTGALVTALGFGLSAFVLLAAIQTSLDANIQRDIPREAPDFFVLDIPKDGIERFEETVRAEFPDSVIRAVPNLRGAILDYGPKDAMIRVAELEEIPEGAWPLRGERGLTYADELPPGNTLVRGDWWEPGYDGEPLVSIDAEFAEALDLRVGDYLTIGVLGVERSARIASLRRIDWESLGFNYVLVFSPNALADAPHNVAATVELPTTTDTGPLLRALVREFPSSSVIEVGAVLAEARTILEQVGTAILVAASVAVLAGLAVLIGAIAAARAARLYDLVMLRVLGASRRQLVVLQLAEFALLAVILALVALALGSAMGWLVVVQQFEFDWLPDWSRVIAVLGTGLALVLGFALAATLPLLRARPAQVLRTL